MVYLFALTVVTDEQKAQLAHINPALLSKKQKL